MTSLQDILRLIRRGEEDEAESINSVDENETDSLDRPPATEPLEEGTELLASGEFGRIGTKRRAQHPNVVKTILRQRSRAIPVYIKENIHSVRIISLGLHSMLCYSVRTFYHAFRILFPTLMEPLWQTMTPRFILRHFPKVFVFFPH
jgi:hypothetical protein